jgi:hypothetical protein
MIMEVWKPFHVVIKINMTNAMSDDFLYIDTLMLSIIQGNKS